jgi:hypothetical protein
MAPMPGWSSPDSRTSGIVLRVARPVKADLVDNPPAITPAFFSAFRVGSATGDE